MVSAAEGSSLAAFVEPAPHATQAMHETCSSTAQRVTGSHVVSASEGSSLAAFVKPAAHATQQLFETCSFTAQGGWSGIT
jgi:hypothetical protein